MSCSWVNRVVLIEAGSLIQAASLIEAGGSDTIVLIEAIGFYKRKYGNQRILKERMPHRGTHFS